MKTRQIKILETTLREGVQAPGVSMSANEKVKVALALEELGVDRIECGFPVASEDQMNSVRQVALKVKKATVVGMARCVNTDIDAVAKAFDKVDNKMLHLFLAVSPIHRNYKLKMSRQEILDKIYDSICYGKQYFSEIEYTPEDASRTEPDFLIEAVTIAIHAGATIINIPDTVGYAIPSEFGLLIRHLKNEIPEIDAGGIELSVHCHNDLGLALANSLEGIENGAVQVETTLNGLGERAGNCALEELVMAMHVRKNFLNYDAGINLERLFATSQLLQKLTGFKVASNKPLFGDHVFTHASPIHQDGYKKKKETYEIFDPKIIGRE